MHGEVRETALQLSQDRINLREIYKGNVYNSNKFLSRQLAIKNIGHVETSFEIVPPEHDSCFVKIDPVKGVLQ